MDLAQWASLENNISFSSDLKMRPALSANIFLH